MLVGLGNKGAVFNDAVFKVIAGEKSHLDAGAGGGKSFLASKSVVNGISGVFFCPDSGDTRGAPGFEAKAGDVVAAFNFLHHLRVHKFHGGAKQERHRYRTSAHGLSVDDANLGKIGLLLIRAGGNMSVAGSDQAEFKRIGDALLLQRQSIDQRLADIAAVWFTG